MPRTEIPQRISSRSSIVLATAPDGEREIPYEVHEFPATGARDKRRAGQSASLWDRLGTSGFFGRLFKPSQVLKFGDVTSTYQSEDNGFSQTKQSVSRAADAAGRFMLTRDGRAY